MVFRTLLLLLFLKPCVLDKKKQRKKNKAIGWYDSGEKYVYVHYSMLLYGIGLTQTN